jgi:hypothetical protein
MQLTPKLITLAAGLFGVFLYFIGLCVSQSAVGAGLGFEWYLLFFLIAWACGSGYAIISGAEEEYRLLIVALTVIGISYTAGPTSAWLVAGNARIGGTLSAGAGLMSAGLIIIMLSLYVFLLLVATKDNSIFNSFKLGTKKAARTTEPEAIVQVPAQV